MKQSMKDLLSKAETIAILGCSGDEQRTSHQITSYLQEQGYRIIPVNPNYETILGEKVYSTLQEVPEDVSIDIADIFRHKKYTAAMVDQIIERASTTGSSITVWTQLDVSSDEARTKAEEAGLDYVENKCMMVEHRSQFGS